MDVLLAFIVSHFMKILNIDWSFDKVRMLHINSLNNNTHSPHTTSVHIMIIYFIQPLHITKISMYQFTRISCTQKYRKKEINLQSCPPLFPLSFLLMVIAIMSKNGMDVSSLISWFQTLRDLVIGNSLLDPVRMMVYLLVKENGTHMRRVHSQSTCICK